MAALVLTPPSTHLLEKKCQVFPSDRAALSSAFVNGGAWLRHPPLRLAGAPKVSSVEAQRPQPLHPVAAKGSEYDVVVVGGGIIGLTVARQLLLGSDLSVAVVDARVPCSGATGAGQGYIWMVYRTPGSGLWELALRSKQLWEDFARSVECQGMDPVQVLGWKKTGSLLIGRTLGELAVLQEKVKMLNKAGLGAVYLSASSLALEEPALDVGPDWGAVFYPDDCQLDAQRAVSFIQQGNRKFTREGRYAEFFNDPAICLLRSTRNGEVEAVQTSKNILYGRRAVIVAAGAWSGSLTQSLVGPEIALGVPVKPRK
ncbi:hypothetical protein Taro_017936, partial [Colocasia esculenta]|nr:hypothetical protein [Colocasia esculenta]